MAKITIDKFIKVVYRNTQLDLKQAKSGEMQAPRYQR